jgi:hypothetical protein
VAGTGPNADTKNPEGFGFVGTAHDETGKGYNTNCHANVETP